MALTGCSPCIDIHLQLAPSPDGRFAAQVTERNCGTDKQPRQYLTLERRGWRGIFSAKTEVLVIEGPYSVQASWSASPLALDVRYGGGAILEKQERWGEIEIHYQGPAEQAGGGAASSAPEAPAMPVPVKPGERQPGPSRRVIGHRPAER